MKLIVWSDMSSMRLASLVIFNRNEKLTTKKYLSKVLVSIVKNITKTKLFDDVNDWTFQQDGATSHTAAGTQQWYADHFPSFIDK